MSKKSVKAEPTKEQPKDEEKQELIEQLQRLQAEFENYKKRIEREAQEFKAFAELDFIKRLLPIMDNFELAFKNTDNKDSFFNGMELIFAQLQEMLENAGVNPIGTVGEKFDPHKHEALLSEENEKEKGKVLELLQKGYELNGKIIRTAKVKVAR